MFNIMRLTANDISTWCDILTWCIDEINETPLNSNLSCVGTVVLNPSTRGQQSITWDSGPINIEEHALFLTTVSIIAAVWTEICKKQNKTKQNPSILHYVNDSDIG